MLVAPPTSPMIDEIGLMGQDLRGSVDPGDNVDVSAQVCKLLQNLWQDRFIDLTGIKLSEDMFIEPTAQNMWQDRLR